MALCVGLSEDGEEGEDKQLDTAIKGNKHCDFMSTNEPRHVISNAVAF